MENQYKGKYIYLTTNVVLATPESTSELKYRDGEYYTEDNIKLNFAKYTLTGDSINEILGKIFNNAIAVLACAELNKNNKEIKIKEYKSKQESLKKDFLEYLKNK